MKKVIELARSFAIETCGIKSPEFHRCQAIAELVESSGGNKHEIATAWLCTVVKNNNDLTRVANRLGDDIVSTLVGSLMDFAKPPVGSGPSKLEEKNMQAIRLKGKSVLAKRVALAVEIVNLQTIADAAPPWEDRRRFDYALGAKATKRECSGISSYLDVKFDRAYALVNTPHS